MTDAGMKLDDQDLTDLIDAVQCWIDEYHGASGHEDFERFKMLLIRLRVRKLTAPQELAEEVGPTPIKDG